MIVKRIDRAKGTSSFRRLAQYILDLKNHGAKLVDEPQLTNFQAELNDLTVLLAQIENVQQRSRSSGDKTYHLVVSFPAGEVPTKEQLRDIEKSLVEAVGLGAHQRISAIHVDTGHLHLHFGINKVHPETGRNVTPRRDYPKLQAAARALELRHGLQVLPGRNGEAVEQGPAEQEKPQGRAADVEAHAGRESFLGFLLREVAPPLRQLLGGSAPRWAEIHDLLGTFSVHLRERGAGFVLQDAVTGRAVRASAVDRDFSRKRLEKQLGPFVGSENAPLPPAEAARYRGRPVHTDPATEELYRVYDEQRRAALEARATQAVEQLEARRKYAQDLRAWYGDMYKLLRRRRDLSPVEKTAEYDRLRAERRAEAQANRAALVAARKAVRSAHPLATWNAFLMDRAAGGEAVALRVLRSRPGRTGGASARNHITVVEAQEHAAAPLRGVPSKVQKDGSVIYQLPDGSRLQDAPEGIHVAGAGKAQLAAALSIAAGRFAETALQVSGSGAFRSALAELAGERNVAVRFADPALERIRTGVAQGPAPSDALREFLAGARQATVDIQYSGAGTGIQYARMWTPADSGELIFAGLHRLRDGSQVALLERGDVGLVLPLTATQSGALAERAVRSTVRLDDGGHVLPAPSPARDA